MNSLSIIKAKICRLYETKPMVHIDVSVLRKKKNLSDVPATITAVYPNIFTAVLSEDGGNKSYTFQYVDLLTNNVRIKELELNNQE